MESPSKRLKSSTGDFVSLADTEDDTKVAKYGYGDENTIRTTDPVRTPRAAYQQHDRRVLQDRRHARDKPKTRHTLPGQHEWLLVRTKYGRKFVHNTQTKQSFWRIPPEILPAVLEYEEHEKSHKEKAENARWAEDQFQRMEAEKHAKSAGRVPNGEGAERTRRRRSESLQREDEEAFMAEIAAEAARAEEERRDQTTAPEAPVGPRAGDTGYDSEGSYEYVEVTDTEEDEEGEHGKDPGARKVQEGITTEDPTTEDDGPVEFGEDDIAYQLATMGEEYGLDPEEYGEQPDEGWEGDEGGLPLSHDDAVNLFRDLLDDHGISPFTPWDRLISDESEDSILNDDRYTVLSNMRARKDVWEVWVRDKAAAHKAARDRMEKADPRIPYLALLADKATPKLYWPEFKRKYKREAVLNDRKLTDKDREKLYRDHVNRLKLPESTRKADLITLLRSLPLRDLHRESHLGSLPQTLLAHLHYISLPAKTRDETILFHIRSLPRYIDDGSGIGTERSAAEEKARAERSKRDAAFEARHQAVAEERRRIDKEERDAKRELRLGERELERAMR